MEVKNKKEINLTKEDIGHIIKKYIEDMGLHNAGDECHINFIVKNEIIPGPDPHDGYDNYVFRGAEIVVTHD